MYQRTLQAPKTSFFLLGPRGTGKSTWLKEHFANAKTFNLLDEAIYQRLLRDESLFAKELNTVEAGSWVIVDEVQRLPWILNEAHRLIEEKKIKFALTGSSARKLKQAGTNLLGGRALHKAMYPLSPSELGVDFDLNRALSFGSIPLVWTAESPPETLESYVHLYLKQEIQAEALVRNLAGFARFLSISALFHGQLLNVSTLARDAGVSRTTVNGYVEILEDTLLAHRLEAYDAKLRVRERKHPKLFFIDPGIVRALKNHRGLATQEELGPLLEGYVFMLLMLHRDYDKLCDGIFYWSPAEAQKTEVDFVLERGHEKIAIEVKSCARLREDHFSGLRAIGEMKGLRRRILVYLGEQKLRTDDGIEVLPFSEFAAALSQPSFF